MLPGIRVIPKSRRGKLDKMSRVDFSRMYTVEHNVKVFDFGAVYPPHLGRLQSQWITTITGGGVVASTKLTNLHADPYVGGDDEEDDDYEADDQTESRGYPTQEAPYHGNTGYHDPNVGYRQEPSSSSRRQDPGTSHRQESSSSRRQEPSTSQRQESSSSRRQESTKDRRDPGGSRQESTKDRDRRDPGASRRK
jgi:hypothetical protein